LLLDLLEQASDADYPAMMRAFVMVYGNGEVFAP
jgi:hypothetical protein